MYARYFNHWFGVGSMSRPISERRQVSHKRKCIRWGFPEAIEIIENVQDGAVQNSGRSEEQDAAEQSEDKSKRNNFHLSEATICHVFR